MKKCSFNLLIFIFAFACQSSHPQPIQPQQSQRSPLDQLQDNTTVVFLGDSITFQHLYSVWVESYFTSRYPHKNLRFVNRGIPGDTAAHALERLERDILPLEPKLVLIMLGMNDGGYKGFNRYLLRYYLSNLKKLIRHLQAQTRAQLVLITPTCVDPIDSNRKRYNQMLAAMSKGVKDLGVQLHVPVIDLFSFFKTRFEEAKSKSPPIQLMLDPIHPGPAGHLVISHYLLTFLDLKTSTPARYPIRLNPTGPHKFPDIPLVLNHLPMFVPKSARRAFSLVPFQKRFTQQILIMHNLTQTVRLWAGSTLLGTFTPEQLSTGIDITQLKHAPWTNLAKQYHELLLEKWRYEVILWNPEELQRPDLLESFFKGKNMDLSKSQAQAELQETKSKLKELRSKKNLTFHIRIESIRE